MEAHEIEKRLAENLKRIRKSRKLTQFELAEKSNCSEDTIKSIELCRSWPSERILFQISNALKIDVYQLFMPVALSFEKKSEIKTDIKKAIAENIREFVEFVLEDITAEL